MRAQPSTKPRWLNAATASCCLGAAGESLGMDGQLRTSTVKRRVHSLFRQGCMLYDLIPNMPEQRLPPLIQRYEQLLRQNPTFSEGFGTA